MNSGIMIVDLLSVDPLGEECWREDADHQECLGEDGGGEHCWREDGTAEHLRGHDVRGQSCGTMGQTCHGTIPREGSKISVKGKIKSTVKARETLERSETRLR